MLTAWFITEDQKGNCNKVEKDRKKTWEIYEYVQKREWITLVYEENRITWLNLKETCTLDLK